MTYDPTFTGLTLEDPLLQVPDPEYTEAKEALARSWGQLLVTRDGRIVLDDIRKVCRPDYSVLALTDRETFVRIGHHEVWLYILRRLGLTSEQLSESLLRATKEEQPK